MLDGRKADAQEGLVGGITSWLRGAKGGEQKGGSKRGGKRGQVHLFDGVVAWSGVGDFWGVMLAPLWGQACLHASP
jgi:hypothetical protein